MKDITENQMLFFGLTILGILMLLDFYTTINYVGKTTDKITIYESNVFMQEIIKCPIKFVLSKFLAFSFVGIILYPIHKHNKLIAACLSWMCVGIMLFVVINNFNIIFMTIK